MTPVERVIAKLGQSVRRSGAGWTALCPAHDDRHHSLSIKEGDDGRVLLHCFAGCTPEAIVDAMGLGMSDLFSDGGGGAYTTGATRATDQPQGCTLSEYAEAKRLPERFLRTLGLTEISYCGRPALRIPAFAADGSETAVQFRLALSGQRFRYKSGSKPTPWGRDRLAVAQAAGEIVLVEGASDYETAVFHGIPVYGLPGAAGWKEERDAVTLADIPTVYAIIEPDKGGDTLFKRLQASRLCDRIQTIQLNGFKDLSEMHVDDSDQFAARWAAAKTAARPLSAVVNDATVARRAALEARVRDLAEQPRILDEFARDIERRGVVGEKRATKLLYLVVTSRFRRRPASSKVSGTSSVGKNWIVENTLEFFPGNAYYALTAMSEHALAYGNEPLSHRHLVLYEAAALAGNEFASYLVRSLLSEGRVRYETVEKTKDGLRPRLIEREGPTGLIVTTTALKLHPENETRLLSIPTTDTPEQTAAIMLAQAEDPEEVDLQRWRDLQEWLATGDQRVAVPYARALARLIPPVAVRLRRDFPMLLTLIETHAFLHQATRQRDTAGRIVATIEDYSVVRDLVADLIADSIEVSVAATIRETVGAVSELAGSGQTTVSKVADHLRIDKSAALRRVRAAIDRGYLKNLEERRGRPAQLTTGDAVPADRPILPPAAEIERSGCTVDRVGEAIEPPPLGVEAGDGEWEVV